MKTEPPFNRERHSFGRRLLTLRRLAKLSQRQVATALGITQPSYAAWERRDVAITSGQLRNLARILGVEVVDLFGVEGQPPARVEPAARVHKAFERISTLPQSRQEMILDVVEMLIAHSRLA